MTHTNPNKKKDNAPPLRQKYNVVCADHTRFGTNTALIGVSLGNRAYENNKLKSLVAWATQHFETVTIMLADSLQRHNIMFQENVDEKQAYDIAISRGDAWLSRNADAIDGIPVMRWDSLKDRDEVTPHRRAFEDLYETSPSFQHAVNKKLRGFYTVLHDRDPQKFSWDKFKDFYDFSKKYLLEEAAVDTYFDREIDGPVLYPGDLSFILGGPEGFQKKEKLLRFSFIKAGQAPANLNQKNMSGQSRARQSNPKPSAK